MTINQLLDPLMEDKESRKKYDYIAVHLDDVKEVAKAVRDVQERIPEDCIYTADDDDYGLQDDLHITIFYGLLPTGKDDHMEDDQYCAVKRFAAKREFEDYELTFGPVSFFRCEDYDVMKIDVESEMLDNIHNFVKEMFEVEETHPDYHPHLTIAYVKKGSCDDLDGKKLPITGKTYGMPDFYYQFTDRQKYPVYLD